MKAIVASWSLILLCFSLAAALGDGLYESIILMPLWSKSPPSSFAIIQPATGMPLQRFWIPVHVAITLCLIVALVLTWGEPTVRRLLLLALVCAKINFRTKNTLLILLSFPCAKDMCIIGA